jgi:transglutaminase-like putative cysteine protease
MRFVWNMVLAVLIFTYPPLSHAGDSSTGRREGCRVSVTYSITHTVGPDTTLATCDVLIPRTLPGLQKILSIRYSTEPVVIYDKEGNRYAQFVFRQPKESIKITMTIDAEIYRYDLATAKGKVVVRHLEKPEDLSQWLVHEPYLESYAPEIQEAAKRLKGKTEEDTTRNALEFVIKTLKYSGYDPLDHGAQWALREKQGDCTEFTNLFVALCRANRIPARTQEGFVVQTLKLPAWVQRL